METESFLNVGEVASLLGARLSGGPKKQALSGVFTDTRTPKPKALFIALRGENFNGNLYAEQALRLGAAAVMADDHEVAEKLGRTVKQPVLTVPNCRAALLVLAAAYRRKLNALSWFAVTGSAGKSTTKELLAHVLEKGAGWRVHKAPRSFNNEIGLSLTILETRSFHQAAVLELGTNKPGEIGPLAAAAAPTSAIITNVAPAHIGAFGSLRAIAEEKGAILDALSMTGNFHLNADDLFYADWRKRARGKELSFSLRHDSTAALRAETIAHSTGRVPPPPPLTPKEREKKAAFYELINDGSKNCLGEMNFTVRLSSGRSPEQAAQVHLPLPGIHNAANALAAVAAAVGAGVPLAAAAAALASFQGMERRLAAFKLKNMLIIDDAYNANPTSFKAALAVLAACSAQRKFVVAGDMLELGAEAEPCHKKLGEHLAEISPAGLVAVGPLAALACQTAAKQGNMACHWVDSPEAAAECIYSLMCDGDAVLIKGSHSVGLDRTVVKLKQLFDLKNV